MTSIPPQCCAVPYTVNGSLYHNCTVNPVFSDDLGCFHANGQWVKCQQPEGRPYVSTVVYSNKCTNYMLTGHCTRRSAIAKGPRDEM